MLRVCLPFQAAESKNMKYVMKYNFHFSNLPLKLTPKAIFVHDWVSLTQRKSQKLIKKSKIKAILK